uniref:Uncharacterized protein n=1 Tax=Anopheles atroparvus TaxID=41427 RepID=A0AAG5D5V4_ANOAO
MLGQRVHAPYLGAEVVHLDLGALTLDGIADHAPVLGQLADALEARHQLQAHEALLVAAHVLQQERVLQDVLVGEVELNLLNDPLARLIVRDLECVLLGVLVCARLGTGFRFTARFQRSRLLCDLAARVLRRVIGRSGAGVLLILTMVAVLFARTTPIVRQRDVTIDRADRVLRVRVLHVRFRRDAARVIVAHEHLVLVVLDLVIFVVVFIIVIVDAVVVHLLHPVSMVMMVAEVVLRAATATATAVRLLVQGQRFLSQQLLVLQERVIVRHQRRQRVRFLLGFYRFLTAHRHRRHSFSARFRRHRCGTFTFLPHFLLLLNIVGHSGRFDHRSHRYDLRRRGRCAAGGGGGRQLHRRFPYGGCRDQRLLLLRHRWLHLQHVRHTDYLCVCYDRFRFTVLCNTLLLFFHSFSFSLLLAYLLGSSIIAYFLPPR